MTSVPIPPSVPDGSPSSTAPPACSGDPQLDQLGAALAAAQGEFQPIKKDSLNPHFNSRYASLDACVHTNKTALSKHGLAVIQSIGFDEHGETLTTLLLHKSGQGTSFTMRLKPVKNDPQGQAAAVTYARRQAFLAITGMTPGDDSDAEPAEPTSPVAPQRLTVAQAKGMLLEAVEGDKERAAELWKQSGFRSSTPPAAFDKWLATVTSQDGDPERPFEREGQ